VTRGWPTCEKSSQVAAMATWTLLTHVSDKSSMCRCAKFLARLGPYLPFPSFFRLREKRRSGLLQQPAAAPGNSGEGA